MTAMTTLPLRPDGWTVADLELLPDDPPFRYELVDGTLVVSPPPPNAHNLFANELSHLLHGALGREWLVLASGAVEFGLRDWRQPDLLVMARSAVSKKYAAPGDVLLALEVMSPSSISTDRLVKPHQYATVANTNSAFIHMIADWLERRNFRKNVSSARASWPSYCEILNRLKTRTSSNSVRNGFHAQPSALNRITLPNRMPSSKTSI